MATVSQLFFRWKEMGVSPVEDERLLLSYIQLLPEQVKALVARECSLLLTLFLH